MLGPDYENLTGPTVLDQLVADARFDILEAFWRHGQDETAQALVGPMASSAHPPLVDLLVQEIIDPRFGDPLATRLVTMLDQHSAPASDEALGRLCERMRGGGLNADYAPHEIVVLGWVLRQPGEAADAAAIDIARGEVFGAEPARLRLDAAHRVKKGGRRLQDRLVLRLAEAPELWKGTAGWGRTALVLGEAVGPGAAGLKPLLAAMVDETREHPDALPVRPEFVKLLHGEAHEALLDLFSGPDTVSAGMRSMLPVVNAAPRPERRYALTTAVVLHQPRLWQSYWMEAVLPDNPDAGWTKDDWRRYFEGWSTDVPAGTIPVLRDMIHRMPLSAAGAAVRVAAVHGTEPGDAFTSIAPGRLKAWRDQLGEDDDSVRSLADLLWWPPEDAPDDLVDRYRWILQEALDAGEMTQAMAAAHIEGRLSTRLAAALVPADRWGYLVTLLPVERRQEMAEALVAGGEPGIIDCLTFYVYTGQVGLEVTAGVAPRHPAQAFDGIGDRWEQFDEADRDRLVDLLEEYGAESEMKLLDQIVAETSKTNANRRVRAARRWAEVAPSGTTMPEGILTLLNSNDPAKNQVAAEVIEKVQPRDLDTLVKLREKWVDGGDAGTAAERALSAVADGVIAEMAELSGQRLRDNGPTLLGLLGAAGSPQCFEVLTGYVGFHAHDEDLGLRRTAASALNVYCLERRLDERQLEVLGALVGRPERERDPEAAANLSSAHGRAKLGDDAAIDILFRHVDLNVDVSVDDLFGQEKHRLLTALKRMAAQRSLGAAGWSAYVEQMDLVAESLVRAAYLHFGSAPKILTPLGKNRAGEPEYGQVLGALRNASDGQAAESYLGALHDIRCNRTNAHHGDGVPLDAPTVTAAESNLREGARILIECLRKDVPLHSVRPATAGGVSA